MIYSVRSWLANVGLLFVLTISTMTVSMIASAHEVRPAYLQIDQIGEQRFKVIWRTPILSGNRLPVMLQFSDGIEIISGPSQQQLFDSMVERFVIASPDMLTGERVSFVGLQATITDVLIRLKRQDGTVMTSLVRSTEPWFDIPAKQSSFQTARVFISEGIDHILLGFDHLLFVLALMFIVRGRVALVKTITAFTVAHSITLTFATLGWVTLPSGPVEIMIAFSIVLIAAEIIAMQRGKHSLTITSPWVVAFAFGLLHGFGFAGALQELGLPQDDIPLALLCFNLGVELGQLMFVAVIFAVVAMVRKVIDIPRKAVYVPAYAIGIMATFWTIERIHSTFM